MAGEWIPWCKGLSRRQETQLIADATGKSRREVACLLMEFWEWADDETEDGVLHGFSVSILSALHADMGLTFFRTMLSTGWLRETNDCIEIPNFGRWMGNSAKRRLKNRLYQAHKRYKLTTGQQSVSNLSAESQQGMLPNNNNNKDTLPGGKKKRPRKEKKPAQPRPRDLLFDALAEVTQSDPTVSGSHVGKVRALLAAAVPPYSPEEVRQLPGVLASKGWSVPVTLGVVEKYIGMVRNRTDATIEDYCRRRDAEQAKRKQQIAAEVEAVQREPKESEHGSQ